MNIGKSQYYALAFLEALKAGNRVRIPDIALQYDIPQYFLYKIAQHLKQAGIIESHEGVKGGYSLKKGLKEISFYDIISSFTNKGDIGCICNDKSECRRNELCASYANVKKQMETKLKEIKLIQYDETIRN